MKPKRNFLLSLEKIQKSSWLADPCLHNSNHIQLFQRIQNFPDDFLNNLYEIVLTDEIKLNGAPNSSHIYRRGHGEIRISTSGKAKKPWKKYWIVLTSSALLLYKKMTDKTFVTEITLSSKTEVVSNLPPEKERTPIFGLKGPETDINSSSLTIRSSQSGEANYEVDIYISGKGKQTALWAKSLLYLTNERPAHESLTPRHFSMVNEWNESGWWQRWW